MAAIPLAPRLSVRWIADPRTDLPFLIGGALAGYALFATHAVLAWKVSNVWLAWYVLSNLPHFFGTYVRTYLDPVERRRRPALLYGSLAWALAGPLTLLASLGLYAAGVAGWHRVPLQGLFVFAALWAYWHVVRQHYGILSLYQRKNADPDDRRLDAALLYIGLLAPLVALVLLHPEARRVLTLPVEPTWLENAIVWSCAAAVGVLGLTFFARQVDRLRRGEPVNVPKVLFMLAVVPLHVFVCFHPATRTAGLEGFAAYVTVFHDIQYQAIVWHAQKARLHRPGVDRKAHGLAALICSRLGIYLACAVSMGVVLWAIGCSLNVHPGCTPLVNAAAVPLFAELTLRELAGLTVLGFAMHHYFLDQFIWRPSKDEGLRRELVEG
jgi:hypothetical protein